MTDFIFKFDTEDYVNKSGADAILRLAETLRSENIRGTFVVVGKFAKCLVEWGRTDVIEAMKYHEIGLHSMGHSCHPDINEYTDCADYEEALANFMREETEAKAILTEIFGVEHFAAACPPGNNSSYVAHYGYQKLGAGVYLGDDLRDSVRNRPVSGCNILCLPSSFFFDWPVPCSDAEYCKYMVDQVVSQDVFVMSHHPQTAVVKEFWDAMNFEGKNTEPENYVLSTPQTEEYTDRFYRELRNFIHALKADGRVRFTTCDEFVRRRTYDRTVTSAVIPTVKKQLDEQFFPVTLPESLCLADMMLACRDFLFGAKSYTPDLVYGFLEEPYAISEPVTVTKAALIESGKQIKDGAFLPLSIHVGGQKLGPGDWLRAALSALCGEEEITVEPGEWQLDLDEFPGIRDLAYRGTWMHCKDFEDAHLSRRFRLQSWTFRLPKGSARFVQPRELDYLR